MTDHFDSIFGPPMSRKARAWSHVTWAARHPIRLLVVSLAAIPAVRRYAVSTTPIKDHPMFGPIDRAHRSQINAMWRQVGDHPAGCFYGSFAEAYPDAWHIPWDKDCPLDHGDNAIKMDPPPGQSIEPIHGAKGQM